MPIPETDGDAPKLGIIILGASSFPQFPAARKLDNPSFGRSAAAFRQLFSIPGISLSGTPQVLDLFDSDEDPPHIIRRIRDFLKAAPSLSDVLIYYCGHGDFLRDTQKTYYLALRATEPDNEAFTALPLRQTRLSLDMQLARKRVFLVLDCCFAGQAVTEWQSDGVGHVIEEQVFQVFPRRGTALIAASAKGLPALAPGAEPLTMFTGALLQTISEGLSGLGPQLSFRDVFTATRTRIIDTYGASAAIPAIHAPHQPDGDISFDPFFANRAFVARAIEPTPAEIEYFDLASADLERPLPRTRLAALETIGELLAETRSPEFKARLVARLQSIRDDDDSSAVTARATAILRTLPEQPPASEETTEPSALEKLRKAMESATAAAEAAKPKPAAPKPKTGRSGAGEFFRGIFGLGAILALPFALGWAGDRIPVVQSAAVSVLDQLRSWVAPAPAPRPYTDFSDLASRPTILGNSLATQPAGNSKPTGFDFNPNAGGTLPAAATTAPSLGTSLSTPLSEALKNYTLAGSGTLDRLLGNQALLTPTLPDGSKGQTSPPGTVQWGSSTDTSGRPQIDATADYPGGRKLSLSFFWQSLPAGPVFDLGLSFTSDPAVEKILGVSLRDDFDTSTALVGDVPVTTGTYRFFDAAPTAANQQLLSSKRWIDIEIAYANGNHAVVSLERNATALKLFSDALANWMGTPPGAAK
ncbi:MAG: uncharacterized protein JWN11_1173 [Hyphomicrobiales bacterium]|nr:uncharacterized protein [Hyphomicrobiales bacterium]